MKTKTYYCETCQKDVEIEGRRAKAIEFCLKDSEEEKIKERKRYIELFCPNTMNHRQMIIDRELGKIPLETKQKFMNLMKDGKSVGKSREEANISLDMACEILKRQIQNVSILSFEVKS